MSNPTQDVLFTGLIFAMGLLAGAATGLLLAPNSGSHTRRQLRSLADDIGEHASRIAEEASEAVNEMFEHGRCLTR